MPISCSYINHQFTLDVERKALEESLGRSWKPTLEELKREANETNAKLGNELFRCTMKIAGGDCARGHDHQIARLASYALLDTHQRAGRVVRGSEKETFSEKIAHHAEPQTSAWKNAASEEATKLPVDATLTLVVKNMAYETTQDRLKAAFAKHGDIKRVSIPTKDGIPKGLGFVDFTKLEDAARALNAMQGFKLDGRILRVTFKGDNSASGPSRTCFSCGQAGHISAYCQSKGSNQDGGGGSSSSHCAVQDQSTTAGWAGAEVHGAGGNDWEGVGPTITQNSTGDWDTDGNEAVESSAVGNQRW